MTSIFLSSLNYIFMWSFTCFSIQVYITYIVYDLSVLKVIGNISHKFLIRWQVTYGWFIDFDNPLEVIVYYLQNSKMIYLGHQDKFSIVSVYGYTLNMTYKDSMTKWLSGLHDFSKLPCCIGFQPWENIMLVF